MRATDILKRLAHADGFESQVVARNHLREGLVKMTDEARGNFFAKVTVRPRPVRLAASGVWVIPHPLAQALYQGMEGWDAPRPIDVAAALERQHDWVVGMPRDVSLYVLGMGERPLSPSVLPYDQPVRREYPCGLVLEPADPAMLSRSAAAQAVLLALSGKDLSTEGIERLAATAAAGAVIASEPMRQALAAALEAGELYGAAEAFAQALLAADVTGYARKAPVDWQAPADPDCEVVVDGWQVREFGPEGGRFCAIVAASIRNHPYIGNGDSMSRSSPLIWIDEKLGWARTQSRLYRLGLTPTQLQAEHERQAVEAEAKYQQTLAGIQEIREAGRGLPDLSGQIDWDHLEATAGYVICATPELREVLTVVIERGTLSEAGAAVAAEMLERVSWALSPGDELDF